MEVNKQHFQYLENKYGIEIKFLFWSDIIEKHKELIIDACNIIQYEFDNNELFVKATNKLVGRERNDGEHIYEEKKHSDLIDGKYIFGSSRGLKSEEKNHNAKMVKCHILDLDLSENRKYVSISSIKRGVSKYPVIFRINRNMKNSICPEISESDLDLFNDIYIGMLKYLAHLNNVNIEYFFSIRYTKICEKIYPNVNKYTISHLCYLAGEQLEKKLKKVSGGNGPSIFIMDKKEQETIVNNFLAQSILANAIYDEKSEDLPVNIESYKMWLDLVGENILSEEIKYLGDDKNGENIKYLLNWLPHIEVLMKHYERFYGKLPIEEGSVQYKLHIVAAVMRMANDDYNGVMKIYRKIEDILKNKNTFSQYSIYSCILLSCYRLNIFDVRFKRNFVCVIIPKIVNIYKNLFSRRQLDTIYNLDNFLLYIVRKLYCVIDEIDKTDDLAERKLKRVMLVNHLFDCIAYFNVARADHHSLAKAYLLSIEMLRIGKNCFHEGMFNYSDVKNIIQHIENEFNESYIISLKRRNIYGEHIEDLCNAIITTCIEYIVPIITSKPFLLKEKSPLYDNSTALHLAIKNGKIANAWIIIFLGKRYHNNDFELKEALECLIDIEKKYKGEFKIMPLGLRLLKNYINEFSSDKQVLDEKFSRLKLDDECSISKNEHMDVCSLSYGIFNSNPYKRKEGDRKIINIENSADENSSKQMKLS